MSSDQAQRPKFYEGQYLGSKDLTTAVDYGRLQAARHALGAHTWGIATGLNLREVETPVGSGKIDMILDPGYAWDGFGHPIVVLAPYKIPPALFKKIKYDAGIDAAGEGRLIEIWLHYFESSTSKPAAGFEVCEAADQYKRIQEAYQVVIGIKKTHLDRHDKVTVAGKSSDAQEALQLFDTDGPEIYDESIPHQTFPDAEERAYWLVPVGYVRWLPVQNGTGSFLTLTDDDLEATRAFRRYIGVVAENIEAADGAIRLRDRTKDPSNSTFQVPAEELVNIEGHLRVEGDVRLVNGKLDFRAPDGTDLETPLRLQRSGDSGKQSDDTGDRELQLVLGPDSQTDNCFSIGPLKSDDSFDPKVTVVSDGKVGIGTTSPDGLLTLQGSGGTYLNVKDSDDTSELAVGADSDGGFVSVITDHDLQLRAGEDDTKMIVKADGQVGIGTTSPNRLLTLQGSSGTYLNVKANDGTYEVLLGADSNGGIISTMTNHDLQLRAGANSTKMVVKTDGQVGIGTVTPAQKLHVIGGRLRLENNSKIIDLRADGSAVDLQSTTSKLYLRSSGSGSNNQIIMNPADSEGGVGIGNSDPVCKLHVAKSIAGDADYVASHVAVIENTSPDSGGDVLALKVQASSPDLGNNFITFFGGNTAVGSIERGMFGVNINSWSADYAEQLPHLDGEESFEAGEVVGILEGKVTHRTGKAQVVSAITDRPVVVANSPRPGDSRKFEKVTFIGQLPVKVRGPVHAGDYIVPSGKDDGIGLAVPPDKLSLEQARQIVGQAWESSEEEGPRRVLTAIGLPAAHGAHLVALLQALGKQVEALQAEVARLKKA